MTRRLKLVLEYDGSEFEGWQLQPRGRSVQGVLEAVFKEITQEELRVHAAGRTDAGVHARGQVAHVDTQSRIPAQKLRRACNALLPPDLAVREVHEVAGDFDARRDALEKAYLYRILNRAAPSPLRRVQAWHLHGRLDAAAMREAALPLLGSHDFAAFRGAPGGPDPDETTRRTLHRLEIARKGDELRIQAEGRSFLRHMVRNLVGTLVEVGQGRRRPSELAEILASGDRARAGPTAPAHGLCLLWIRYPGVSGAQPAPPHDPGTA